MPVIRQTIVIAAVAAATAISASPATAADYALSPMPTIDRTVPGVDLWDADAVHVERNRRYRGREYRGRGYRQGHHRRYRDRGIDAGDVLTGVLILGGIAAVIDAVTDDDRDDRDDRYRTPPRDGRYDRGDIGGDRTGGLERAASICRGAIERGARVSEVDDVRRTGVGWTVTGTMFDGQGFVCRIDNNGDVQDIAYGGEFAVGEDRQYDEATYRAARLEIEQGRAVAPGPSDSDLPAYPGGPVNGEVVYADEDYDDGNDARAIDAEDIYGG
ncbi:MAG: hypothetical protein WA948_11400 [Pontixanthobacter sp.]